MASGGYSDNDRRRPIVLFNHTIKDDELHNGDHIYAHRIGYTYSHHGIWDSENKQVIHFNKVEKFTKGGGLIQITRSSLDEFLNKRGLKLHVYNDPFYVFKLNGTSSMKHANPNASLAVEVARWFAERPTAFGEYDSENWNCESFATFCKTTDCTAKELSEHYDRLGSYPELWQCFLSEHGCTESQQKASQSIPLGPVRLLFKMGLGLMVGAPLEKLTDDL